MRFLRLLPQRLDAGATPTFAGILAGDGTAAAPSISFLSDPDTGFYRVGSGLVGFASNGVSSLIFRDGGSISGNGAQFITLNAGGAISFAAGGTNQNITLTPSGTGQTTISSGYLILTGVAGIGIGGTAFATGDFQIGYNGVGMSINTLSTSRFISFGVNSVEKGRFAATTGNFLLGTTTDSGALLQVGTNTSTSAGGMVFGTDTFLHRFAAGTMYLAASGTNAKLILRTANSTSTFGLQLEMDSSNAGYVYNTQNAALYFGTNNTLALTLDSSQRTILAGALRLSMAYTAGVGAATGYLTVQDSGGTTYKIPVLV